MRCLCLVLSTFVGITTCVNLPRNFIKCNRHQADFKDCILKAAQNGISQMYKPHNKVHLPKVEPLQILEMSSTINSNLLKLNEQLKNCTFFGISKANVTAFEFNLNTKAISASAIFPKVEASCAYTLYGSIFTLPFYGEGFSSLDFSKTFCFSFVANFNMSLDVAYEEVLKNNRTYARITSSKVDGRPENLRVAIGNLFDGDEEAGRRINRLINDNWRDLYDDVKDDHLDLPAQMFAAVMSGFFSIVSLEEMFD